MSGNTARPLPVRQSHLVVSRIEGLALEFLSGGRLAPWLGPALRGVVARVFKDRVCRQPPLQRHQWTECRGCEYQAHCAYAHCFDPAPSEGAFAGQLNAIRGVVLEPAFPAPTRAEPGLRVPLRVTCLGDGARLAVGDLLELLLSRGERHGLGPDRARFGLVGRAEVAVDRIHADQLPSSPHATSGTIPRLTVELTTPLFLKHKLAGAPRTATRSRDRRQTVREPQFVDLVRAALRVVGGAFAHHGTRLPADFRAFKEAARAVQCLEASFAPFAQPRVSTRKHERYVMRGCVGRGAYADVPLAFVPWLVLAGRLHVGMHRVGGAGAWHIVLE